MYLDLFQSVEEAVSLLIAAQQKAEEDYASASETLVSFPIQHDEESK